MANTSRGFTERFLFIKESTYGTTPTTGAGTMVSLPFISNGLGTDEAMIDSEVMRHNRRDATAPSFGNRNVSGDVVVPIDAINFGYWLELFLGAPVTTGAGPYTHTYEPVASNPSWSVEGGFSDNSAYFRWTGIKGARMALKFAVGTEVNATLSLLGKDETASGTTQDSAPVEEVYEQFQAKGITLNVDGSPVAVATEVTLNLDNGNADDLFTLSSDGFRVECPEGKLMIKGSATVLFRDLTYYNLARANTEVSLEIVCTLGTNELTLTMPEVVFPLKAPERAGYGPVKLPIEFTAYWQDDAGGYAIQAVLVNDKSSYA